MLFQALHAGEEPAFLSVVERHHPCLVRIARALSPREDAAAALLDEAWMRFLRAAARLEVGPPLRVWLMRVLVACARERAASRGLQLDLAPRRLPPAVPASRFRPAGDRYADNWAEPPRPWDVTWDEARGAAALHGQLARLSPAERVVFTLRDVDGWPPEEVCAALDIDDAQHRALLNLARSRFRSALEQAFSQEAVP